MWAYSIYLPSRAYQVPYPITYLHGNHSLHFLAMYLWYYHPRYHTWVTKVVRSVVIFVILLFARSFAKCGLCGWSRGECRRESITLIHFLKENDDVEAHNWHCWEGTKGGLVHTQKTWDFMVMKWASSMR